MAYQYGIKNVYRPTSLIPNAYGWSTRPQYNRADVPTALLDRPTGMSDDELRQQFAYEWFQSGQLGGDRNLSNPPFVSGAAGRLHPALRDQETGRPARILRGYIRRAQHEAGKPMSKARLYFMYNPEVITRDYVSYLNQSALDPFNTVFESKNDVAPPSFMDFSFELFFDRQEEAQQIDHPGVFVDYQFFDLVVRNVVPQDPNQSSNTLPDNGVMMVNPMDITVVFSPQLTVQGRPLNASVMFEKFTHRMVPTRMRIQLQMRVIYIGPIRDITEYRAEEMQAEAAIGYADAPFDFGLTFLANEINMQEWLDTLTALPGKIWDGLKDLGGAIGGAAGSVAGGVSQLIGQAGDANDQARVAAVNWARDNRNVVQGGPGEGPWTDYEGASSGARRYNLPESADCSGLITEAYIRTGNGQTMGWQNHPGTSTIMSLARANPKKQMYAPLSQVPQSEWRPGDILIRDGHIAFYIGDGRIFDAAGPGATPEVGERDLASNHKFTHLLRPTPIASSSSIAQTTAWNATAFQ